MSKPKNLPDNAIPIYTYDDLNSFAVEFRNGDYDFVANIGDRGLGKSYAYTAVLPKDGYCLISGAANSPFQVYQQSYEHRCLPIVFDDADNFWENRAARPMGKQLCETSPNRAPRLVSYRSREIERLGLPTSFYTTSRIVVVCNDWPKGLDAVADRGIMLYFRPTVSEVHEHVLAAPWFDDPEVLKFMDQHLHLITSPTMRYYINASRMRKAGRTDWQEKTLLMIQPDKQRRQEISVVSALLRDPSLTPPMKVERFKKATGLSQATYYRMADDLAGAQGRPEDTPKTENLRKPAVAAKDDEVTVNLNPKAGESDAAPVSSEDGDGQDHLSDAVESFCGEGDHHE